MDDEVVQECLMWTREGAGEDTCVTSGQNVPSAIARAQRHFASTELAVTVHYV